MTTYVNVGILREHLPAGAEAWWRSLSPSQRAHFIETVWECYGFPTPEEYQAGVYPTVEEQLKRGETMWDERTEQ